MYFAIVARCQFGFHNFTINPKQPCKSPVYDRTLRRWNEFVQIFMLILRAFSHLQFQWLNAPPNRHNITAMSFVE